MADLGAIQVLQAEYNARDIVIKISAVCLWEGSIWSCLHEAESFRSLEKPEMQIIWGKLKRVSRADHRKWLWGLYALEVWVLPADLSQIYCVKVSYEWQYHLTTKTSRQLVEHVPEYESWRYILCTIYDLLLIPLWQFPSALLLSCHELSCPPQIYIMFLFWSLLITDQRSLIHEIIKSFFLCVHCISMTGKLTNT